MKHVRKQYNRFSFRLSLLGTQVDAGESYETEQNAAIAADLTKHYLRTVFALDLEASLDGESFSSLAYGLNVDLTNRQSVWTALPQAVRAFIEDHDVALSAVRDSAPEKTPWAVMRCSPDAMKSHVVRQWVFACERAELDCEAFAALNGKYFLGLVDGLASRSADMLKPLALAVKMHAGVVNPMLVERLRLLTELQTHLKANEAYIKFLAVSFAEEQAKVISEMTKLENNRPTLS